MLQFHIASKPTENEIALYYEYFKTLAKQWKHFSWRNGFKSDNLENITAIATTTDTTTATTTTTDITTAATTTTNTTAAATTATSTDDDDDDDDDNNNNNNFVTRQVSRKIF